MKSFKDHFPRNLENVKPIHDGDLWDMAKRTSVTAFFNVQEFDRLAARIFEEMDIKPIKRYKDEIKIYQDKYSELHHRLHREIEDKKSILDRFKQMESALAECIDALTNATDEDADFVDGVIRRAKQELAKAGEL